MRYTYAYKTSDGTRHEATMDAESREAVFSALRAKGIKAIKVVAADGSKANGEVHGVRKRVVVLIAVCAAVVVGVAAFWAGERGGSAETAAPSASAPRHQIYGEPAIMGAFERGDFGEVLTNKAVQMLAWFAQPGRLMCPKGIDPRRMAVEFATVASTVTRQEFGSAEPREVRELKQIVNGMIDEFAEYLANGNGTPRSYWRRLVERTQQEMQIYERTRRELEGEKNESVWDAKNAALLRLGLRTLVKDESEE